MFDFYNLEAEALIANTLSVDEQLDRVAVLQGAARIFVTEPENDETGRFWFFLSGIVRGEPISVPHVVSAPLPTCRVVNAPRLMAAYRQGIMLELRARGYTVTTAAARVGELP